MSIGIKHKVSHSASSGKCTVCENYTRQIEEVAFTLSGRDAVIKALHNQLKKFEANYRKLIADFEQLRFQHCSALQDNFSLREINNKLTEITSPDISKKPTKCCKECPCVNLDDNPAVNNTRQIKNCEKSQVPILDEINNIEKLVSTQYHILKDLLGKVVKEVKLCTSENLVPGQDINEADGPFRETESGDHLNTNPKFELLGAEIEKLRNLVDQHQKENNRIKQYLLDKRNRLTRCTKILSHFPDINPNISLLQKDQEISATEMADETNKTKKDLEFEMQQKERQFEKCCCQLIEELNEMHDNNQALSDTLSVITQENKNNVNIVNNLKNELNRVNDDYEAKIDKLKLRIGALESQLDESKLAEKTFKESAGLQEQEIDHLRNRLKNAIDENSNIISCKCAADGEMITKLMELETANHDLRKDLSKKMTEIGEFGEENKSASQKLDILNKDNAELANKVRELQQQLAESADVKKQDVSNQTALHQSNISQQTASRKDQECLNPKCRQNQIEMLDKLDQLDSLKNSIKLQREEINKINKDNGDLKEERATLNNRNKMETERLQELVNHSQNQVAVLLKEHDEKTAQFQNVANELDNIRTSVTKDNDHLMAKIGQLQQEKESLKKENQLIKICQCEEAQDEIDRLKMELCKKQCIILELEKSVDNFNETLRNFDSTAEELACENACLKADRARLLKELEIMQQEVCVNNAELVKLKNQTEINGKSCSERNKALEQENEALKNNLIQLNMERRDLEKELVNNCHKQMEVENMKQDYTRRVSTTSKKLDDLQTAYNELKSLFDKTYAENEKLRAEFKNHAACKEDLQQLLKQTENFQSQNEQLTKQADSLKNECNQLRKECTAKCVEALTLKEAVEDKKQQKRLCDENCQELKQQQKSNEMELLKLREQLGKMCEQYERKSEDLKKVQKQWECCAKQCQISRDEYNNLRKEYKDIKAMLTDQIKKYKVDGRSTEAGRNCKVSNDIKEQLMKKENEIATLHQKLKNAACEIIELKDYVQKLICENNLLKSAINSLISNLENKIKGPSFGSLPSNSAEVIAGEILHSLTTIEDIIVKKGDSCPKCCPGKCCDCMSEITQQYSYQGIPDASKTDLPQAQKARISICSGSSQNPCEKRLNMERSSQFDCVERCKKLRERLLKSASEHLLTKTSSAQIGLGSETNTTDSDELHPTKFHNK